MRTLTILAVAISGIALHAEGSDTIRVWAVDPLTKVFQDAQPASGHGAVRAEIARGECASFQFVVRSDKAIANLTAELPAFKRRGGHGTLQPRAPRFVGYVPVDRPSQAPSKDQLRKPPADYPDPLLECPGIDVKPGIAQPVWLTIPIPEDAAPGVYTATLSIHACVDSAPVTIKRRVSIRVYKAVAGRTSLWVTDWFAMHALHMKAQPERNSDAYYELMRRYARNMAEHRHTVALISPLNLGKFSATPDGKLAVDFSEFDRWVDIFKQEGVIGRIEGGHIGGRKDGWESEFVVTAYSVKEGKAVAARVDPASPEADAFYGWFFPTLVAHLREKGWIDCYLQHLADEPIAANIAGYRAMAKLAHTYAPEIKTVEACHSKDLVGSLDVWVPQLNYLDRDFAHYQQRQQAGEEVWFYTCVFPQGEYANRFVELPLIKTRLLHWINYRYGITGYLHWGYNQWTPEDPFTHTTRPHGGPPYLPAGDAWIVYPGENGPLDSIRFEAMRDGIADYELLAALAKKDKPAAEKLAARHILEFAKYDTNVEAFRATRRDLLKRLSR